jgi:hypothetical protein
MIAKKYGPGIGALFLAFPAILPASATLIEKHEKQKKERLRMHGSTRARQAVAIDAAGAAIGSIGLLVFALVMARWLPNHRPGIVMAASTLSWMIVSLLIWPIRKRMQADNSRIKFFRELRQLASVSPVRIRLRQLECLFAGMKRVGLAFPCERS